ncbi:AI-2E family transporter [Dechloromonas sp. XY25]|uniref:AI-2E family transporter n=1 Tax=Dechloromonas hankyongensis TaxID=2908002 RepID=A0ABS9JXR7_9RHOO|nr:AI-2E family transporter [Dechloromonas hankyongensis]MCG2575687.1 AI-2E family transporter [Dechloromonas hankyongensis]
MIEEQDPKRLAQMALVVLLIIGCIALLLPFIGAVLFAFVIWMCSWRFYAEKLLPRLAGRDTLGASLMTLGLVLVMLLPMLFLAGSLASGANQLIDFLKDYLEQGLPSHAPSWLSGLPVVGSEIDASWHRVARSRAELTALLGQLVAPARQFALVLGGIVANGLLQLALVLFVVFFLYRDGTAISQALYVGARKLGGELGEDMLDKARGTVVGVMLGIVGTAAAQGTVAMIGFLIAGVPTAMLLGFATFFLSMIPIGPPLIWGGAAAWLYNDGQTGWAIFMVLYGLLVISSIDNFVKPILIARGAGLSILLIALGVLGGVLVFGFIGIFLGPVLLALGDMLLQRWLREELDT